MKVHARVLLISLALLAPLQGFAEEYALRTEDSTGRADLTLGETPKLVLRLAGAPAETLEGVEVVGGYLFTAKRADLQPRNSSGITGALSLGKVDVAEVLASSLKLREGPSTSGRQIDRVRRGEQVEVLEERDGWVRVRSKWSEGWIKARGERDYLERKRLERMEYVGGKRSVFIKRAGRGWRGNLKRDASTEGPLTLRKAIKEQRGRKRILLVPDERHGNDGVAFRGYAEQVARTYAGQGYQSAIADVDCWEDVVDELQAASGAPYARVVFIAHGGWDGPVIRGQMGAAQVSPTQSPAVFAKFIQALKAGTQRQGRVLASSCHAGGTARGEASSNDYRWVHDLAAQTGRQVAGPAGFTSTEYTLRHTLAALEGRGTVAQEVHVARGAKVRVVAPGRTLASAKTMTAEEFSASRPTGQVASQGAASAANNLAEGRDAEPLDQAGAPRQ
tara:strand:+ start:344 stop:1687 length:1344 start_codon:yes stop_codon:yes gene_type:complete